MIVKIKQTILIIGDIVVLYISLGLTLLLRYGAAINKEYLNAHLAPFSILFIAWLAIFYIGGLYEVRNLRNTLSFVRKFLVCVFASALASITLFYLIPYFHISPKTNLVIFVGVFVIVGGIWKMLFNSTIRLPQRRMLILGEGIEINELIAHIQENPQIGYMLVGHIPHSATQHDAKKLIEQHTPDVIIISEKIKNPSFIKELAQELIRGIEIIDSTTAYQTIFKKLPLLQAQELWLTTRISHPKKTYEATKSIYEPLGALGLFIILSPLLLLIYVCVRITSKGPGIYKQIRVGKGGKLFWIYKFRTMRVDAEKNGAVFAQHRDPRVTTLGNFLRFSHLDELAQLINIIRNEISFVGPRPERPEFVTQLNDKIPYYKLRHLVRPGITGWAQVNCRANIDLIDDTYKKLQYDMFYVQERSFIFDALVILKTIKMFLFNYK